DGGEQAQEVKRTDAREIGGGLEVDRLVQMVVEPVGDLDRPTTVARRRATRAALDTGREVHVPRREQQRLFVDGGGRAPARYRYRGREPFLATHRGRERCFLRDFARRGWRAEILPWRCKSAVSGTPSSRETWRIRNGSRPPCGGVRAPCGGVRAFGGDDQLGDWGETTQSPQAWHAADVVDDLRLKLYRQALVPADVVVRAGVFVVGTADQDRARDELVLGAAEPVAEAALPHVGQRKRRVPLDDRPFTQPRVAAIVDDSQAAALEESGCRHPSECSSWVNREGTEGCPPVRLRSHRSQHDTHL